MPNPENILNQTKEQLSANGKKGAASRAAKRKQQMAMAEELRMILSLPVKRSVSNAANKMLQTTKAKALEDFNKKNTTVQTQILLKLNQMAMSGNLRALQMIIELLGEANPKKVSVAFDDSMKDYYENLSMKLNSRHIEGVDDE